MAVPWGALAKYGLPILGQILGFKLLQGGQKPVQEAAGAQAGLAKAMEDLLRSQSTMDLPYRGNMLDALQKRSQQQFPSMLPKQPGAFNPLQGGHRPTMPMQPGPGEAAGSESMPDFQTLMKLLSSRG
jgi:hypothetical protein